MSDQTELEKAIEHVEDDAHSCVDGGCPSLALVLAAARRSVEMEAEIGLLRAAIATPEVYVGVVSEIVERDFAAQLAAERERRAALVQMCEEFEDDYPVEGCAKRLYHRLSVWMKERKK